MPTFIFYKNKVKVDEMKGADAAALEEKIKRLMGDGEEGADEVTVKGHVSVITLHYILHYITIITSYTLHLMGGEEKEPHTFSAKGHIHMITLHSITEQILHYAW